MFQGFGTVEEPSREKTHREDWDLHDLTFQCHPVAVTKNCNSLRGKVFNVAIILTLVTTLLMLEMMAQMSCMLLTIVIPCCVSKAQNRRVATASYVTACFR